MAHFFLDTSPYSPCLPLEHKPLLASVLSKIHSYILTQSGGLSKAGILPTFDSQPVTETTDINNLTPYGFLVEKMSTHQQQQEQSCSDNKLDIPYVGPLSLNYFMECLCQVYKEKSNELKEESDSLRYMYSTVQCTCMYMYMCIFTIIDQ